MGDTVTQSRFAMTLSKQRRHAVGCTGAALSNRVQAARAALRASPERP